jgi:hypothetical protein
MSGLSGAILQEVATSDAFRVAAWPSVVLLVVPLIVHYFHRLAQGWKQLSLTMDVRAARKAALTATTPQEREHALKVLAKLLSSLDQHPVKPPRRRRAAG